MSRALILALALVLGSGGAAFALPVPKPSPALEAGAAPACDSCSARKADKLRLREMLKQTPLPEKQAAPQVPKDEGS